MSLIQSNLSSCPVSNESCGYPIALSLSQYAINNQLIAAMSALPPAPEMSFYACNNFIDTGQGVDASFFSIDPFSISSQTWNDGNVPEEINALLNSDLSDSFLFAIRGNLGNLEMDQDFLILIPANQGDNTYQCNFQFNFQSLQFVVLDLENGTWNNNTLDTPGGSWFTLNNLTINLNTNITNLPTAVETVLNSISGGGTVNSLSYSLYETSNNAYPVYDAPISISTQFPESSNSILGSNGVASPAYSAAFEMIMQVVEYLSSNNFDTTLAYIINPNDNPINLNPVNLGSQVSIYSGANNPELNTFNIIMSSFPMVPYWPFTWDWIEPPTGGQQQLEGTLAINFEAWTGALQGMLTDFIMSNCYIPSLDVHDNTASLTPITDSGLILFGRIQSGNPCTILSATYNGAPVTNTGFSDTATATPSYTMLITSANDVNGNSTISIVQHLVINLFAKHPGSDGASGNIIDYTLTNTYSVVVNSDGSIGFTITDPDAQPVNNSVPASSISTDKAWDLEAMVSDMQNDMNTITVANLENCPLSQFRNLIFPGGGYVAFSQPGISDYGDLICDVNYIAQ